MAIRKFIDISHSHSPFMPVYFLTILFFLKLRHIDSLTFNFSRFKANCCCINYEGNATVSRRVIQLTIDELNKSAIGSVGRATYCKPIHLWDKASGNLSDFYTSFTFAFDSQGLEDYGDGLAFFLSAANFPFLNSAGGGGLGLTRENKSSKYPFVAVEFDTFINSWDPSYQHVGININSVMSNSNTLWLSRVPYGGRISASIKYDSTLKSLTVTFSGFSGVKEIQQNLFYVIDLRDYLPEWVKIGFSAATGSTFEKHSLYSWYFTSNLQDNDNSTDIAPTANPPTIDVPTVHDASKDRANKIKGPVVGIITVGGCVFVGIILILLYFFLWKKGRGGKDDENAYDLSIDNFEKSTSPRKFSYIDLVRATNSFSEEEKLGEGGSGAVYRGFLKELDSYVAVKRISANSKQGIRAYSSEIRIISQLRHRNLVQLLGWCHEKMELLLVYELMPNRSLDTHLFNKDRLLTWEMRYSIAQGLASGLLYLQEEWEQLVVHRDIKSSNIMLDSNFNAKLGDFGLARFVDRGKGSQTTVLAGTLGYMAPECVMTGKASKESDVYSFGIVALEIACGRKSINLIGAEDQTHMVQWVWDLYGGGKLLEAADPRLDGAFDEQQLKQLMIVGLWCAHPDAKFRPSSRQVIQVLNFEASLPVLPSKIPVPTYLSPEVNTSSLLLPLSATIS